MKLRLAALALFAAAPLLSAQGGQKVVSHDGGCQVTVPAGWQVSAGIGLATSADKSQSAVVSSPKHMSGLADVKQIAPTIYKDDKVVKDSGSEFQMEGQSGDGKPNVYRAVPVSGGLCLVEVKYTSGTIDDARKIAESLKSAK